METNTNPVTETNLTVMETEALAAIIVASGNQGGDFTFSDEVSDLVSFDPASLGGVIGSLVKKHVVTVWEDDLETQITLADMNLHMADYMDWADTQV